MGMGWGCLAGVGCTGGVDGGVGLGCWERTWALCNRTLIAPILQELEGWGWVGNRSALGLRG
jgi:hypothetical protein